MGKRLFRTMCWAVGLGVAASAVLEPWRVTAGFALGGALALVNHHWLSASVRTAFSGASLAGVSTLDVLAYAHAPSKQRICALLPAGRTEWYAAL